MAVDMPGIAAVPAVGLCDHADMEEPVGLQRLPEVARRVRGDAAADVGHLFQLRPSRAVRAESRFLSQQLRVFLGVEDERVAGDIHRRQLLPLVGGLGVVHEIKRRRSGLDLLLYPQQPRPVDLSVQRHRAGRALLQRLRDEAAFVNIHPLALQPAEYAIPQRTAAPVGNDFVFVKILRLVGDVVGDHPL